MKKTLCALSLMIALSPALAAQSGFGEGGSETYVWAEVFMNRMKMAKETMDTDKDGAISKEEYMKFAEMNASKKFADMDMNNDGTISEAEWMNPELAPGSTFYGLFN